MDLQFGGQLSTLFQKLLRRKGVIYRDTWSVYDPLTHITGFKDANFDSVIDDYLPRKSTSSTQVPDSPPRPAKNSLRFLDGLIWSTWAFYTPNNPPRQACFFRYLPSASWLGVPLSKLSDILGPSTSNRDRYSKTIFMLMYNFFFGWNLLLTLLWNV